jgi:predicted N-formylglutamate amidohydrolase
LTGRALESHIAWDIGAAGVAERLSEMLDAALVMQRFSRLAYDCNRPPEAADAYPERSEIFASSGKFRPRARPPKPDVPKRCIIRFMRPSTI